MKILILLFLSVITAGIAQDSAQQLLGDFQKGWEKQWLERRFTTKPNHYEVVQEDTNSVLMVESDNSASGLWRMLDIHPGKSGKISWRWKVAESLSDKNSEKSKMFDDYAARVFVVFEPHFLSWKTRALCYVWAGKEPMDSIFRSPYAESVGMIVLQSGNKNKGKWMTEERDPVADYRKIFQEEPEMISAVAIMVDTDNTSQKAAAWFDDLALAVAPAERDSAQTNRPKQINEIRR
jgi:hypothetical protein